jgi:hypothetical protein
MGEIMRDFMGRVAPASVRSLLDEALSAEVAG